MVELRRLIRTDLIRLCVAAAIGLPLTVGCGSTRTSNTARTATEQLLISDAVDRTIQQINFGVLRGETVFFDPSYMNDVVDKGYVVSSLRQHLLASGCILKENRADATFVVEPRVGAVGTDNHDLLFGIPALQVPQVAAGAALPAAIPEIPFAKRRDQQGIAKIAVFAYRRDTGEPVWQSGMAMNKSTANDIWLFGAGPFQRGTIYEETRFAGGLIKRDEGETEAGPSQTTRVETEAVFAGAPPRVKQRSGVVQASAEAPIAPGAGPPLLPPARPIAEAPTPASEDPAKTAG